MAYGLVDYIAIVVAQLTNVTPARREGNFQEPSNPTSAIMDDIKGISWGPASDAAKGAAKLIKKKTIDQKYSSEESKPSEEKKEGYTGKIFASRNDADNGGKKDE